jgi:hypothetical protein
MARNLGAPYLFREEKGGEKEQGEPKLLLTMDPAERCQHRSQPLPLPNEERQEGEEQRLQI